MLAEDWFHQRRLLAPRGSRVRSSFPWLQVDDPFPVKWTIDQQSRIPGASTKAKETKHRAGPPSIQGGSVVSSLQYSPVRRGAG